MALKILLVDDEIFILKSLKRVLVRYGYEVFTASSGFKALEILKTNKVEIIITDFRMPEMDGADLLRHVKRDWPDCVSMVLSGYADFQSVVALLNEGLVFRFLEKPWRDSELLQNIKEAELKYQKRRAKAIRDQLLIGSTSALLEIDHQGTIKRFNAPMAEIIPDICFYTNKHLTYLNQDKNKPLTQSFVDKHSSTLFINNCQAVDPSKKQQIMIERYLSDEFCQLLKLSANSNPIATPFKVAKSESIIVSEPDFYEQLTLHETNSDCYSLVYVGIAQFQLINDLLGKEDGNYLIEIVQDVLSGIVDKPVKVYHQNADKFLVFVPNIASDNQILTALLNTTNQLIKVLPKKYANAHVRLYGVYGLFPEDNINGVELINQMQLIMNYQASEQAHTFSRFDPQLVADYKKNFELSCLLLNALEQDETTLRFQPKIDTKTGQITSAEVLIRWYESSKYGWVSPAQFIHIAECDGQIIPIGRWVIAQTCKALKYWAKNNTGVNELAINLSARQLKDDPSWIDFTIECLQENDLSPSQLIFELTETYLVEDFNICEQQLTRLRALGFKLQIDDFGVGYSSLGYLSKLPVDGVKLDRSLITDIKSSLPARSMIRNIIRMSHDLGLKVVAEGVETAFQCELVKKLGCDYIQGYYYAEPLNIDDFSSFLTAFRNQGTR